MCGLIGWVSKDKKIPPARAIDYVVNQFEDQQGRGTRGFGIVKIDDKGIVSVDRATEAAKMFHDMYTDPQSRHILFHHRMPTSSDNLMSQTHPMAIENEELTYKWLIAHNGVISNDEELKAVHEKAGYLYETEYRKAWAANSASYTMKFNDSEAIAIELARFFEGKIPDIGAKGGFTFWAISRTKDDKVHQILLGTNGYAGMKIWESYFGWAFASEETLGQPLEKDEVVVLEAVYKEGSLVTFTKLKKTITMKYTPEPPAKQESYSGRSIGFGTNRNKVSDADLKKGMTDAGYEWNKEKNMWLLPNRGDKSKTEDEYKFVSQSHIVHQMMSGPLGKVFTDSNDHAAIETLEGKGIIKDFNLAISMGDLKRANELFVEGIGLVTQEVSYDECLEEALEEKKFDLSKWKTFDDIDKVGRELTNVRMSEIAGAYVPVFQFCTYCEVVLALAAAFTNPKTDAEICDNENNDAISENFDKDIEEAFPSKPAGAVVKNDSYALTILERINKPQGVRALADAAMGRDDERITDAEFTEVSSVQTPVDVLEGEAELMLEALSNTGDDKDPFEILEEAEGVGSTILNATEMRVDEYLRKVVNIAAEEGLPLQIGWHINNIKTEMDKFRSRCETLAHIVKAAKLSPAYADEMDYDDDDPGYK